jgi:hypothetical protein
VKVDDYCDPSSAGTLTRVKSIEYVYECLFATDCAQPAIVGYFFFICGDVSDVHCMLKSLNLINKIKMLILIFEMPKF